MTPPPADSSHPATTRLATALRLSLAYRAQGRSDAQEFLAEHRDLADLLEPMIAPQETGESGVATSADAHAGGSTGPAAPTIAGYRIDGELGQGGMSIVWSAVQTALGRPVALKVMRPVVVHERMQRRFMREAAILARLDHPHIVRVFDAATSPSATYLALERVDGTSLAAILAAVRRAGLAAASGATIRAALAGALPEQANPANDPAPPFREQPYCDAIVELLAPIAAALHYAHVQGVIHRDVKPSNILVRRDGRAVLSDFGIARDDAPRDASESVALAGTPDSLAPEQLDGGTADARSDVYGLGVTLYAALTLQPPFAGHPVQVLAQIRRGEPRDPRQLNPEIPRDLAAVLAKAMAKAPHERYADAAGLAADLRAVLARAPVSARPVRPWRRWRQAIRRRPWRAAAWACGALATLLALGLAAGFSAQLAAQTRRRHAALAEIERLGWSVELDRAIAAAAAFTPPHSAAIPAMEAWLDAQARPLLEATPSIAALRDDLQQRALPYGAADAEFDRRTHPEAETSACLAYELERAAGDAPLLVTLRARHAEVAARVATRRTFRFAAPQDQFLYDQTAALLARLEAFAAADGTVARVHAQRELAAYARRSLVDAAAAWSAAIAQIAAEPRYAGLRMRAREGLVPLGQDPRSGLFEFVHLASGERGRELPQRGADGALQLDGACGIVLVLLPPGQIAVGAQATDQRAGNYDPEAGPYEAPVQEVVLDAFLLGKWEVTLGQWLRLGGSEPGPWRLGDSNGPGGMRVEPTLPVANVSQAQTAALLASHGLALPTEAQWEYACRAGTSTPWSFGERAQAPRHANVADHSARQHSQAPDLDLDDGFAMLAPAGSFLPNRFGLYDMHGNVAEWCRSMICRYDERPARAGDGARETFEFDEPRYLSRGGSFTERLTAARSANRWAHATADERGLRHGARACLRVELDR